MATRVPPSQGYDRSERQLSRYLLSNPLRDFLKDLAIRDRVVFDDDFLGDAINLDNYAVAQSQTSTSFAVVVGRNGTIAGTTAAVTTASVSLVTPIIWYGDANCSFEARLKINTVANTWIIEGGLIDAVPGSSGPGIADIDTATGATMTCGALFHVNNNQTHAGIAFGTIGGGSGQTFATTLVTSGFTTPVADTYLTIKVQLINIASGKSAAYLWVNGRQVASHVAAAGAVKGDQGLAGWIYLQSISANAKVLTVDYLRMAQDRNASE